MTIKEPRSYFIGATVVWLFGIWKRCLIILCDFETPNRRVIVLVSEHNFFIWRQNFRAHCNIIRSALWSQVTNRALPRLGAWGSFKTISEILSDYLCKLCWCYYKIKNNVEINLSLNVRKWLILPSLKFPISDFQGDYHPSQCYGQSLLVSIPPNAMGNLSYCPSLPMLWSISPSAPPYQCYRLSLLVSISPDALVYLS